MPESLLRYWASSSTEYGQYWWFFDGAFFLLFFRQIIWCMHIWVSVRFLEWLWKKFDCSIYDNHALKVAALSCWAKLHRWLINLRNCLKWCFASWISRSSVQDLSGLAKWSQYHNRGSIRHSHQTVFGARTLEYHAVPRWDRWHSVRNAFARAFFRWRMLSPFRSDNSNDTGGFLECRE